jgi:hypothetical protein
MGVHGPSPQRESGTLSPRTVRLAALLKTVSTRSVTLPELWGLWASADPRLRRKTTRRASSGTVLKGNDDDIAAEISAVRWPSGTGCR